MDTFLSYISRIAALLASLGGSVITARTLGPDGRGNFFYLMTAANTVVQFCNLGLASSNTILALKHPQQARGLIWNSVFVSILVPFIGLGLFLPFSSLLLKDAIPLIYLLSVLLLLWLFGTNFLLAFGHVKAYNAFQILNSFLTLLIYLSLSRMFRTGVSYSWFVCGFTLSLALSVYLLVMFFKKKLLPSVSVQKPSAELFKRSFNLGVRAYTCTLMGYLILRFNVFALAAERTSEELGFYSIAMQICDVLNIFPQTVGMLLFPKLVQMEPGARWRLTIKSFKIIFIIMLLACGFAFLLAPVALPLVFGSRYIQSVPSLNALLPGIFCLGLLSVLNQYLSAASFPFLVVVNWVIGFVCICLISPPLVRRFGSVGSGVALSITYVINLAFTIAISIYYKMRLETSVVSD